VVLLWATLPLNVFFFFFRKMMAELEKLKSAKKPEELNKLFPAARSAMAEYLEGVELPALGDERYDLQ